MTRIKIILWAALFTAILVSCGELIQKPDDELGPPGENEFYAQNIETGKYYKVKAEIVYDESEYCVIWAEEGSGITPEKAEEIARKYDDIIRPKVVDTFSKRDFDVSIKEEGENKTYHFDNMLDYANWLVYGDDKRLTILLLDIKDGYKEYLRDSYVAGYFWGGNFYSKGKIKGTVHYSNGRDMIYVDTNPGLKDKSAQTYATLAHELQHLINYVTTVQMGKNTLMDIWIDEGLSSQAEYLYSEEKQTTECKWFINDEEGTIARGNNFFVWDNHRENLAILDEYATVYLFFRWLYLQAASVGLQSDIFLKIETSNFSDYRAVTDIAQKINPAWNNWETLLRTWLTANYYPKNSYGYTGDVELQNKINEKKVALITTGKTISLYPGEGVYSKIEGSFSPAETSGIHIRYAGLTETTINTSPPSYTGNVLLTFNANTRNTASREIGSLTGVSSLVSRTTARNIQTRTSSGPYVIDARDMLERSKR